MIVSAPAPTPIDQRETTHLPYVHVRSTEQEPRRKEVTDPLLLRVEMEMQVRIPWTRYPWQVKDIGRYSLYELVFAAIEHCCKRHHGEIPQAVHVPLPFLPKGGIGTIYFHQVEVRVCANEKLPWNMVLCVR